MMTRVGVWMMVCACCISMCNVYLECQQGFISDHKHAVEHLVQLLTTTATTMTTKCLDVTWRTAKASNSVGELPPM